MTATPPTTKRRRSMGWKMGAAAGRCPALLLVVLGGCATLRPDGAGETCRDVFLARARGATTSARVALARSLTAADLHCLLETSRGERVGSDTFFVSPERRRERRVQRFAGTNDQLAFRDFEKQMFVLTEDGHERLYGYNVSGLGRSAVSPGWFRFDGQPSDAVLDYRADFVRVLTQPRVSEEVTLWSGYGPIAIANNDGSILFGDLQDTLFRLDDDAAIGVAERVKGEARSVAAVFILVRAD